MAESSHIITNTCICNLHGSSHGSHSVIPVTFSALLYSWCPTLPSAARRLSDQKLSLRQAESSPKQKVKRSQLNRQRDRPTSPVQPTHRYKANNINTTRPYPTHQNPTAANAPRPSTTARQSPISMSLHTYAPSKHAYIHPCMHCIASAASK
jgi:hypothetical protein